MAGRREMENIFFENEVPKGVKIGASIAGGAGLGVAALGAVGTLAAGPVGTAIGATVGLVGGGIVGGVAGLFALFSGHKDGPSGPTGITDEAWREIWNNVEASSLETKRKCDYLKHHVITNQTEERRVEQMHATYDEAIKNGVAKMSCGRVCVLGVSAERNWIKSLVPIDIHQIRGMHTLDKNNMLCPMSQEEQLKGLATLVCDVVIKNPRKYKLIREVGKKSASKFQTAFRGVPSIITSDATVDDKICIRVKDIITSIKNGVINHPSDPPTTPPALIHATSHSWEQLKYMLPLFITSRSLFIVEVNHAEKEEAHINDGKIITLEREDAYRCIECITGALSEKARALYAKLKEKELNPEKANQYLCPYPKIVMVGTYISDKERSQVQSTIENIKRWVILNCSDACRENIIAKVDQLSDDIQAQIANFISHDLKIPTPLSWELFRQMFSYVTKNVPIIPIEKAATIASICDIATDEFPSVLNFYHEHGAFLYYADVEYLSNIIIIDPKWLQEMLNKIFTPVDQSSSPMWKRLTTQGVLVVPLCEEVWRSEEVENLPTGMIKLLEKYYLASPIDIEHEMYDVIGDKYFLPFVLKSKRDTAQLNKMPDRLYTAPLHITFPKIKHLPPGIFNCLTVALASRKKVRIANVENEKFKIDFKSEMLCDQISFWFGRGFRDKVILRGEITSISVVVERLKYCGDEYLASNFWLTCQKILTSLTTALKQAVQQVWNIEAKLAFCCTCQSSEGGLPHYVSIDTDTKSTCNTLRCEENREYTLNGDEHWWLKMADTHYKVGKIFKSEINYLATSLTQKADQERLIQALEITSVGTGSDFTLLMSGWADTTGPDARIHLVYHLIRINLREVADGINKGRHRTNVNIENDPKQGKVHTIYA